MKFSLGLTILLLFSLLFAGPSINSQSLNTELLSVWDDPNLINFGGIRYNDLWGYASADGREYAIVGSANFTHFIDITDPTNPVEADRVSGQSTCIWRDYKTYRHYAYGVADNCNASLQIFDLRPLPDSVILVYDSDEYFDDIHNIFIDTATARLYASGYGGGGSIDIIALDLSEDIILGKGPDNPQLLQMIDLTPGYVHDLFVRNDTAYCSHGNDQSLYVYDFTDLTAIDVLGAMTSYTGQGYNHSNWVSEDGNTLILADETHNQPVKLVDISDLDNIEVESTFKSNLLAPLSTSSIPHNPYIVGNDFGVISYYHDGIQIYKIDSIGHPFRAGYYDTYLNHNNYSGYEGCWGAYPYLPSGNIIGSDIDNGLFVIGLNFPIYDCDENVVIKGIYDKQWDNSASSTLRSSAQYSSEAKVSYQAQDAIELQPGFQIDVGASLKLSITDNCQD